MGLYKMARRSQPSSGVDPDGLAPEGVPNPGRIFISWSGETSRIVADALNGWLQEVVEGVETFISTHNIAPGTRWGTVIDRNLKETNFGIICLTPDNLGSPWILFEAGALSKAVDHSRVIPYLFRVSGSDVKPPLGQFNHVAADRDGTLSLLRGVNTQLGNKYEEPRLERKFDKYWPDLEKSLATIPSTASAKYQRKDRELIEEMLELVRRQERPETDALKNGIRDLNNQLFRLSVSMRTPGYTAIFDSGFDLDDYIGLLPISEAERLGDGTLYAYWRSVKQTIEAMEQSGYDDNIPDLPHYRQVERDINQELQKRVMKIMSRLH